jgi:hypothetical protein
MRSVNDFALISVIYIKYIFRYILFILKLFMLTLQLQFPLSRILYPNTQIARIASVTEKSK